MVFISKKNTKISGWGNHRSIASTFYELSDSKDIVTEDVFKNISAPSIPRGNGRSYGDSALQHQVLSTMNGRQEMNLDEKTGILHCGSGVLLKEVIRTCLPKGWFLPVTPGTKFVTIGGAIAADVHGKNHYNTGCFSEHVQSIELLTTEGKLITCSAKKNTPFFRATCGGMGLTGLILSTRIKLKKVTSAGVLLTRYRLSGLKETIELIEKRKDFDFSVAWFDVQSNHRSFGRSIVSFGCFADSDFHAENEISEKKTITLSSYWPGWGINEFTARLFNEVYFALSKPVQNRYTPLNSFFYPLDFINNWNRMYGRSGFLQYQFVLPWKSASEGLEIVFEELKKSRVLCTLAVLKRHGPENQNLLSFPMEGYSLALDFKISASIGDFLEKLNSIVIDFEGRINLCKDAIMSREMFNAGYPGAEDFREFRRKHNLHHKFQSLQSERLHV